MRGSSLSFFDSLSFADPRKPIPSRLPRMPRGDAPANEGRKLHFKALIESNAPPLSANPAKSRFAHPPV